MKAAAGKVPVNAGHTGLFLLRAARAGLKQRKAAGNWSITGIAQDREHPNPGCLSKFIILSLPWLFLWTKTVCPLMWELRTCTTLTGVGSEINLIINSILLIIYLLWGFLKYQMLLCKHHSYLDRLSHTLPPLLSHSSRSCEPPRADGCCLSLRLRVLGTGQLRSCSAEVELLGVTQKRNDATGSKKLMKW